MFQSKKRLTRLAADFLQRVLNKEQFDRYAAFEVIKHPWLKEDEKGMIPLKLFEQLRAIEATDQIRQVGFT
jgi:serine/threonine protein kinase